MESGEVIALLIVGALGGSAAAIVTGMTKRKRQSNWMVNTFIGIIGALVGALLFDAFDFSPPDMLNHPITAAEILMAFVGAVIVIVVVDIIQKR